MADNFFKVILCVSFLETLSLKDPHRWESYDIVLSEQVGHKDNKLIIR